MSSSPWVPYFFSLYIFIMTYVMMMNYDTIKDFSSSMRTCNGFIALSIALVTFAGLASIYNIDNRNCDYHEKINELM